MSHVVGEIRKFCETTSVRGIPRIFKSKANFLKILWTFAVVVCTALLIVLLITLFGKFYQFPVATRFGQDLKGDIQFPDITICSLNRFLNDLDTKSDFNLYLKAIENKKKRCNGSDDREIMDIYNSIYGYIISLPRGLPLKKDCPSFVASCNIYFDDWTSSNQCTDNFTQIWDAEYYSCHTIKTSKLNFTGNNNRVKGMMLVLNIGPPYDDQIPSEIYLTSSQASGVRVAIHSPGSSPDFKRGFTVGPGTENTVKIVQTNIIRLDKPHNPNGCTKQKDVKGSSETYAQDVCFEDCIQLQTYAKCKCVVSHFFIPDSLINATVCGNFSILLYGNACNPFDILECFGNIYSSYLDYCLNECLLPCSETTYSHVVISSSWPPKFLQMGVYKDYFSDCIEDFPEVKERYAAYYQFDYSRQNGNEVNSSSKKISVSDLKQLEESLLLLKLVIEDDFPYSLVDKEAYTWDIMVGLVGGMLSLWLGVSATTAFELIELLYFIFKGFEK